MDMNLQQKKAVEHIDGPFICIAGPGSGKTTVIIHRVLNLIKNNIDPTSILVVTFTKAAAKEMRERYEKLEGAVKGPVFSTIHSFSFNVIKKRYNYNADSIMDENAQKKYIRRIIQNGDIRVTGSDINKLSKNIISDISLYKTSEKNPGFKPSIKDKRLFYSIYDNYENYKEQNHMIDYDDMLILCRKAMSDNSVRSEWRNKFSYIMIDEFQDTSKIQADILYTLAAPKNNIFISGDDDQSIYAFRNARPDIMLSFKKDFPNANEVYLTTNYRSEKKIIKAASSLITHNKVRFDKDIKGNKEGSGEVVLRKVQDKLSQEEALLSDIKKASNANIPYKEMSILCRTNREVCSIAKILSDNDIPFYSYDQLYNIHSTWVCKVLVSYIKIAYGLSSPEDLLYVLNKPSRFISEDIMEKCGCTIEGLKTYLPNADKKIQPGIKRFIRDIEEIKKIAKEFPSFYDAVDYIQVYVKIPQYINDYCKYAYLDADDYHDILGDLILETKKFHTIQEYFNYLSQEDATFREKMAGDYQGVMISTMHKSKGLEWDCVFIPSCNHGNTPYIRKKHMEEFTDAVSEEERRLMYVALTRARKKCVLYTYSECPSEYLTEAGLVKQKKEASDSFDSVLKEIRSIK